jgi:hypothetical protein
MPSFETLLLRSWANPPEWKENLCQIRRARSEACERVINAPGSKWIKRETWCKKKREHAFNRLHSTRPRAPASRSHRNHALAARVALPTLSCSLTRPQVHAHACTPIRTNEQQVQKLDRSKKKKMHSPALGSAASSSSRRPHDANFIEKREAPAQHCGRCAHPPESSADVLHIGRWVVPRW